MKAHFANEIYVTCFRNFECKTVRYTSENFTETTETIKKPQ